MPTYQLPLLPDSEAAYQPAQKRALPVRDQAAYRVATNALGCSVAELMELVLQGFTRKSAANLAGTVLNHFNGDIVALSRADAAALQQVHGMNARAAAALKAAMTLGTRMQSDVAAIERPEVNSPADAAALVIYEMGTLEQEHLRVILLNSRNRVLGIEEVYKGSVNSAQVHVGEVFKPAIRRCATAMVIIHNHRAKRSTML